MVDVRAFRIVSIKSDFMILSIKILLNSEENNQDEDKWQSLDNQS